MGFGSLIWEKDRTVVVFIFDKLKEGRIRGIYQSISGAEKKLEDIEDSLGFRIIMTNRHDWDTASIIEACHGQSKVENAFKNLKNPYHLTVEPQFHWTDHKVKVHFFICVLGYKLEEITNRGFT